MCRKNNSWPFNSIQSQPSNFVVIPLVATHLSWIFNHITQPIIDLQIEEFFLLLQLLRQFSMNVLFHGVPLLWWSSHIFSTLHNYYLTMGDRDNFEDLVLLIRDKRKIEYLLLGFYLNIFHFCLPLLLISNVPCFDDFPSYHCFCSCPDSLSCWKCFLLFFA